MTDTSFQKPDCLLGSKFFRSGLPLRHERVSTKLHHENRGMRSDGAQNASERWRIPRKSLEKILLALEALQLIEIPRNHQRFLWKSLEKNKLDLERLAQKAWSLP
jgi:hypothetical protein